MLKKILPFLLLAFLAMPGMALAGPSTLNPLNGNAWTLYVFGNGDAIFHILQSIKLLMLPENGSTGFNSLMMFLATVGFLVLAIQAGFDPAKNLMKMFSYIMVVGAVHMMTMSVTANIRIKDAVTNYDNVVPGVPALVGVPAALISEIGHWFTKTIETYYNIPTEMTVSGGAFNLFGRLMQESNEFVISNPELKKSLSAYTADCVVPAMAQGRMKASDLMTSPKMADTLGKASHNAIMTKYWPSGTPNKSGTGVTYNEFIKWGAPGEAAENYPVQGGLGAVLPCAGAWQELSADMERHAEELVNASARQWSKTGVLIPFETAMSSAMAMASNGGANAFGNYSKPQGYILQQAMLNSMNGSFRSAAASIGNNDVLMAASIAQAEQSQKSSWFTAARVFTNMMGYVYTTLQAFIFAIVPIVIIALMVPGLGKSIFTNYSQILVWLMLWQPMLSIVNYLITLFGKAQIASSLEVAAGVTMQNKYIMTEQTNDLMLAAQFLGTSVPLLTWGLVKGSLAFTEFISHGIGSSMAQQAGATAATGNMSMNNMSMDNASMNKFNTAMSSAVGAQTTMGYTGGSQSAFDAGGHAQAQNGAAETRMVSSGVTNAQSSALNQAAGFQKAASENLSAAHTLSQNNSTGKNDAQIQQLTASAVDNLQKGFSAAVASGDTKSIDKSASALYDAANTAMTQLEAKIQAQGGVAFESDKQAVGAIASALTGAKASASAGVAGSLGGSTNSALTERASRALSHKEANDLKTSNNVTDGGGHADSLGRTNTNQTGTTRSRDFSEQDQVAMQHALATSASRASGASRALQTTASNSDIIQHAETISDRQQQNLDGLGHGANSVRNQGAAIEAQVKGEVGDRMVNPGLAAMTADVHKAVDASPAQAATRELAKNRLDTGAPQSVVHPGGADVPGGVQKGMASAAAKNKAAEAPIEARKAELKADMKNREDTGAVAYAVERGDANLTAFADKAKELKTKFSP